MPTTAPLQKNALIAGANTQVGKSTTTNIKTLPSAVQFKANKVGGNMHTYNAPPQAAQNKLDAAQLVAAKNTQPSVDNPFQFKKEASTQLKENNTDLPNNLKAGVENLSGISLNDVKVHYNSDKPAQLQAYAFAQGTDIHVASGQERHLPHEAWHVVQQKQGRVRPTLQMKQGVAVNDDAGLENEADIMGMKALSPAAQLMKVENGASQSPATSTLQKVSENNTTANFVQQKTGIIQTKKTGAVPLLPKAVAKRMFAYSEYKDLNPVDYGTFVHDELEAAYNECLTKGTGYWNKLQNTVTAFNGSKKAALINDLTKKRKAYDLKFKKNYVTNTRENGSYENQYVGSSGLAADGDKVDASKDVPYSNSVDFQDKSITASHNYAERDLAREADKANKDDEDYETRGLPNSEILWQQYKAVAQKQFWFFKQSRAKTLMKELSIMKRRQVQNRTTLKTIMFALPDNLLDYTTPHTWQAPSEEFLAMLGTPNCMGAAFLLLDHIDEVDGKSITDIELKGGIDANLDINIG